MTDQKNLLEIEYKKVLQALAETETLSQDDLNKIWTKFVYADEDGKREALYHLNEAWRKFENSAEYITRLSNEDTATQIGDLDAQYGAMVTLDAEILNEKAMEAEAEAEVAEEEYRKQNEQYISLQNNRISKPGTILSLNDLIGVEITENLEEQNKPTAFTHTSHLAGETNNYSSQSFSPVIPQRRTNNSQNQQQSSIINNKQVNSQVSTNNIPIPQNSYIPLPKQGWKPGTNLIKPPQSE